MAEEEFTIRHVEMFAKYYLLAMGIFFIAYGFYGIFITGDNLMGSAIGMLIGAMGLVLGLFTDSKKKGDATDAKEEAEPEGEPEPTPEPPAEEPKTEEPETTDFSASNTVKRPRKG